MEDYSAENIPAYLEFVNKIADFARERMTEAYNSTKNIEIKDDRSPVTTVDREINQYLIDCSQAEFPDFGVLAEEKSHNPDKQNVWICDPLDGTIGFITGDPTFCFSIALVAGGSTKLALVENIMLGTRIIAIKGQGAKMDQQSCHVSDRPVDDARLILGTKLPQLLQHSNLFTELSEATAHTNIIHGAVFKSMLVAQGLSDVCVMAHDCHPWDIAAAKLIIEEAGGIVTDLEGNTRSPRDTPRGIIISSAASYPAVLEIVSHYRATNDM